MTEETLNIFERIAENDKSTADVLEDVVSIFEIMKAPWSFLKLEDAYSDSAWIAIDQPRK